MDFVITVKMEVTICMKRQFQGIYNNEKSSQHLFFPNFFFDFITILATIILKIAYFSYRLI